jgi:uncharacterized protein (TIGR02594 family)
MLDIYELASRFIGLREVPGHVNNPQIMAMLQLDQSWPDSDEVAWCSAYVNYVAWLAGYERSKSLRARSWMLVGLESPYPQRGDGVVLRQNLSDPGKEVVEYPGHAGFLDRIVLKYWVLAGNQNNEICVAPFDPRLVISVRRLRKL